jgi:DNA-binding NarL/FixJ family response regulator
MTAPSVRILVADDHEAVREGLRKMIELHPGWTICGTAANGREALEQTGTLKPDIVVLDIGMHGLNGLEATRQIRRKHPQTEVLIYTGLDSEELIPLAFDAGAKSFILKSEPFPQLLGAIESLSRHKPFFPNAVTARMFAQSHDAAEPGDKKEPNESRLTARERETVQLLAEGKSNKEVAAALGVSIRTAETHRARLLRKLGLKSLAALVRYAIRNGIIQP